MSAVYLGLITMSVRDDGIQHGLAAVDGKEIIRSCDAARINVWDSVHQLPFERFNYFVLADSM